MAIHSPKFKFWVTKTKKFKLLSIPELSLNNVLCLPVKVKVSVWLLGLAISCDYCVCVNRMLMILHSSVSTE